MKIQFAKMAHIDETTPKATYLLTHQTQSTPLEYHIDNFFTEQYTYRSALIPGMNVTRGVALGY